MDFTRRFTALFGAFLLSLCLVLPAKADPVPLEYWAIRDTLSNVELSPDGKLMGMVKTPSRDANPILEIYNAANLNEEPYRIGADSMEIQTFGWLSDDTMIISFRGRVKNKISGFNDGVYRNKIALFDYSKKKFKEFDDFGISIEQLLPGNSNKIVVSLIPGVESSAGGGTLSAEGNSVRARAYYEFDLKNGRKKLILNGSSAIGQVRFDSEGNPRYARGFDDASREFIWYVRAPGEKSWNEIFRLSENSFENFGIAAIDETDPNKYFVVANNGNDKEGLWLFNAQTKQFEELIYRRGDVDVTGVRRHSNNWTNPETIIGVGYYKDKTHIEYFDETEGAIYAQLQELIPNAFEVRIGSRSRNGNDFVIRNVGPKDPGSYYLLKDGKLSFVGSENPLIKAEDLSNISYIQYPSRDGRTIAGFVTRPKGNGPFPLIVLPHGGPFVGEQVNYDEWAQMLANNGYMVLQPEYRGSQGYGIDFYTSAFINGGQGGYKMQDDKDDGALYLVSQGLVDPNRMAFFGWSYGGYAALIAAARDNNIYQCSIAGAAVADNQLQVNYYRYQLSGSQKTEQLKFWDESISPIDQAEKVNIPLLLVHGSVDQRVPIAHMRRYTDKLDAAGIKYKFVELEGADHFYNTLYYDHQIKLYTNMIDFLKNDCGPGGL